MSSPTTSPVSNDDWALGGFGVKVTDERTRVDLVFFDPVVEVSGRCSGVALDKHPSDDITSYVVLIAGGPLDPIECQLVIDGDEAEFVYRPTAEALREVMGSEDCVAVGPEDHIRCPADPGLLEGGDVVEMAEWFFTDQAARDALQND